jgi:hypothetical protein
MSILRVVVDEIEFFIDARTGESGMSVTALARLCGVTYRAMAMFLADVRKQIREHEVSNETKQRKQSNRRSTMKQTPENGTENPTEDTTGNDSTSMKQGRILQRLVDLSEQEFYLRVPGIYKNLTVIRDSTCALIITYYATESRYANPTATYSLTKFVEIGIRQWIHDETDWQHPTPELVARTRAEALGIEPRYVDSCIDRHSIYNDLLNKSITASMYRVYLYLLDCDLVGHRPGLEEVCQRAQVGPRSLYDLVERMRNYNLVPEWFVLDASTRSLEAQIRDRLHKELGGEIEVPTAYGPIDLLTATELIEIKRIEDWKTGFGQVLTKAQEHPTRLKRLHLFGNSKRNLRNIKACCQEFDISITFEPANLVKA